MIVSFLLFQSLYGEGYTGLVRINLWRYGHWITVYIDDRYENMLRFSSF